MFKTLKENWGLERKPLEPIDKRSMKRKNWIWPTKFSEHFLLEMSHLVTCSTSMKWKVTSQPAFTCSKLTIETLEEGVKYVQS